MELISRTFIVYAALTLSMGCALINGVDLAFNVYSTEIKETFNLTQTQVEVLASLDGVGMGLGILEIPIFHRFGCKVSFITTCLMMSSASGALSLAAMANESVMDFIWVIYIAQLIMASGNSMSFMVMTRAVMEACPTSKTGTMVGMFGGMTSFGKVILGALMDIFFTGNLTGFFLTLCLTSTVLFSVCFGVLTYLLETTENVSKGIAENGTILLPDDRSKANPCIQCDGSTIGERPREKASCDFIPFNEMVKSSFFHALFWPLLILYATPFTIMNNITTLAISQKIESPLNTVYIIATSIFLTRIICGVIKDKYMSIATGFILILSGNFVLTLGIILLIFYLSPISVYAVSILVGISLGSSVTVCFAMLMEKYGKQHFGILNGVHFAFSTVTLTLWQLVFGFVYDSNIATGSPTLFCYVADCFYGTFVAMFVFVGIISMIQICHFIHTMLVIRQLNIRVQNVVMGKT